MARVQFRGDWYELPESLTLGESAFVERKLDANVDDLHTAEMMLALSYFAVKRVRKITWDEIANLAGDDLDFDGIDDEDAAEADGKPVPKDDAASDSKTSEPVT